MEWKWRTNDDKLILEMQNDQDCSYFKRINQSRKCKRTNQIEENVAFEKGCAGRCDGVGDVRIPGHEDELEEITQDEENQEE